MAKVTARNVGLFGGGRDLSGRSNSGTLSYSAETPDTTTFGLTTRERLADGLLDYELSVGGWMDLSACKVSELFEDLLGASARWGYYPEGATASKGGKEMTMVCSDFSSEGAVEGAATYSATMAGTGACSGGVGGMLDVTSLTYATVSAVGSSNLGSVDFAAACAGHTIWNTLRVTTMTGTTPEISACIQSSTDDSSFTTIAVMTTASAADQVSTASATSSNRYRRARVAMLGTSPCATFQISSGSSLR